MPEPTTKSELLQLIRDSRSRLEQTLARLDEQALEKPGPDGWAIKDHLAHLAAWSRRAQASIDGRPAHEALGLDESDLQGKSEDEINARLQAKSHQRPAAELLAEFRRAHDSILQEVESLPDDSLFGPNANERLLGRISSNTFGHDDDHLPWIEAQIS
jgi:uncharacterized protein (TIGR03083 family)